MSLKPILEKTTKVKSQGLTPKDEIDISVSAFTVLYNSINSEDVSITTTKEKITPLVNKETQVKKEGDFKLHLWMVTLADTLNSNINGDVKIEFTLKSEKTGKNYRIVIHYAHLSKKLKGNGVSKVWIGADNKTKAIAISQTMAMNLGVSKNSFSHAKQAVRITKNRVRLNKDYPAANFKQLLAIIFIQLKNIIETDNFRGKDE
jgi:hypothetical protein